LAIPSFWAIGWFLYEDYEKGFFYVANRKRQGYRFAGYFVYRMAYYSVITASLGYTGRLFISPVAAVVIFLLGVWMLFYAVKLYKLRTAKAAKALMLVSVVFYYS
jgi:protoheme IX farnesyltransferase